jgi:Domain of unknown function (DUF6378)
MSKKTTPRPSGETISLNGAEILHEAHDLITGARQQQYDHPSEDYSKVVDIFYGLTGVELTVQEALCFMVAVKMARLRTARERGTWHHDSLVDAMGYLGCMNMVHVKK